jgi:hypothetical protein
MMFFALEFCVYQSVIYLTKDRDAGHCILYERQLEIRPSKGGAFDGKEFQRPYGLKISDRIR